MSRTERLFDLIQLLRRYRYPVNGAFLATELNVSLRTVYRDIASLQAQGAEIEGEPGIGYILKPGFMLPPLMFSEDEIEALVLGSRWVAKRANNKLSSAAQNALAKIASVLPNDLRYQLESSGLLIGPGEVLSASEEDLALIGKAIRFEKKINLGYIDLKENESRRIIWPLALVFFDQVRIIVAWCELRQDYRHFRTDKIKSIEILDARYPKRRQALLKVWRKINKIPEQ